MLVAGAVAGRGGAASAAGPGTLLRACVQLADHIVMNAVAKTAVSPLQFLVCHHHQGGAKMPGDIMTENFATTHFSNISRLETGLLSPGIPEMA